MSAVRIPNPDGTVRLVPVDDGAVGRIYGSIGYVRQMGSYLPPDLGQISRPSDLARRARGYAAKVAKETR